MKLKMFNGTQTTAVFSLMAGGYDADTGHVTLMVRETDKRAGTLTMDVSEARALRAILDTLPDIKLVEPEAKHAQNQPAK